jgi:hypothetical protein
MSNIGELTVVFSTKMKTQYIDLSWLNNTIMDLYIEPAENRDQDDGFDVKSVNFTWNVTEYGDLEDSSVSKMVFMILFDHPLEISPLKTQDQIVLHIKDKVFFFISEPLN